MTHNQFCLDTNSHNCTCDREGYIKDLESQLAAAKAEIEHWQTRTRELLNQKDGIDPDVFGTVCCERDVAMEEIKRLKAEIESLVWKHNAWKGEALGHRSDMLDLESENKRLLFEIERLKNELKKD